MYRFQFQNVSRIGMSVAKNYSSLYHIPGHFYKKINLSSATKSLNHSTIVIVIVIGLEGVDFDEEEVVDKVIWMIFFPGGGAAQ